MQLEMPQATNAATYFVDRNVKDGRGDKVAVIEALTGATYTYREVLERVNRFGHALREQLDVRPEERILLLLHDTVAFPTAFFGAIKVGAIPIPTNILLKADDYRYLLEDSRAQVLVVDAELLPQMAGALEGLRHLRHVVVVGGSAGDLVPSTLTVHKLGALLADASPELVAEPRSRDDACFWLYSSGTTGFPKAAVHLQHDMLAATESYARGVLKMTERDSVFSVAKLFFAYGLGNGLYFPFALGGTSILYPGKPDADVFFSIISSFHPSLFFSVPTAYQSMLAVPDAATRYDLSSVRACVSAGEALPAAVWERWKERFGIEILDGIGSTEVLHIFISNVPGACRPGTSGKVVTGYEARVVDQDGNQVGAGEIGDLTVSGDSTCAYYWNQHERTKDAIQGHWFRTGDKYSVDDDGYFTYHGRSDDMIKAGGIWVSPNEVEATLVEHPAVFECAVVGAPDAAGLCKPKAFVVCAEGHLPSAALADELVVHVKSRIAKYKYPRWVEFLDDLPKTATGKVQRYKLR
jgi:benzoate-CoA ligase family protein